MADQDDQLFVASILSGITKGLNRGLAEKQRQSNLNRQFQLEQRRLDKQERQARRGELVQEAGLATRGFGIEETPEGPDLRRLEFEELPVPVQEEINNTKRLFDLKVKKETEKLNKTKAGKELSQSTISNLAAFKALPDLTSDLKENLDEIKDTLGPATGRATIADLKTVQAGKGSAKAAAFNSKLTLVTQNMVKAFQGSRPSDRDLTEFKNALPKLSDTPEVAVAKIDAAMELLEQAQRSRIESFKAQGFNIKGFEIGNKGLDLEKRRKLELFLENNPDSPKADDIRKVLGK